jgi:RNA polymerase-binding transcription factor DksA
VFDFDKIIENHELLNEATVRNFVTKNANAPVNKTRDCTDCDEEIDPKRLAVLPSATRCIDCAIDHEEQQQYHKRMNPPRGVIENITIEIL